jgi:hypothetical protein
MTEDVALENYAHDPRGGRDAGAAGRSAALALYGPEPVHEGQAIVDALTEILSKAPGV